MGISRKQALESARKQMEKAGAKKEDLDARFAELKPVQLKKGTEYLVHLFGELSATRPSGMDGPQAISYQEIKAFCELMSEPLTMWEVSTLKAMDRAFLKASTEMGGDK